MRMLTCALAINLVSSILLVGVANAKGDNPVPANISPEAQAHLQKLGTGMLPQMDSDDPEMLGRLRKMLGSLFLRSAKQIDPNVFTTEQNLGDSSAVRAYWVNSTAPAKPGRVILYIHGGGYTLGSALDNLGSAIRIRAASGIPVLSVDYRLAPEHPFPAAVDDSLVAYQWLLNNGYNANKIGVYGDSAGGALALAVTLAARDAELPLPAAVVALSPLSDVTINGDSRITLANIDPVLRFPTGGSFAAYVGDADPKNPLVSPVYADYRGFPELLIQVGTREQLMSDSVRLAAKVRADGGKVTLDVWDGMWHGWHDQPGIPEAEQACKNIGQFFVDRLKP